jgi:hypothetical protein
MCVRKCVDVGGWAGHIALRLGKGDDASTYTLIRHLPLLGRGRLHKVVAALRSPSRMHIGCSGLI